jgi:hypothetical protein
MGLLPLVTGKPLPIPLDDLVPDKLLPESDVSVSVTFVKTLATLMYDLNRVFCIGTLLIFGIGVLF